MASKKNRRGPLPAENGAPRIERPGLPPRQTASPLGLWLGVVLGMAIMLALGWWLGSRYQPRHELEHGAPMGEVSATVSPSILESIVQETMVTPTAPEPVSETVLAPEPKPEPTPPPTPKPVVTPAAPSMPQWLVPRRPPAGDGHVLNANQVLYCLAAGELLEYLDRRVASPEGFHQLERQTEDYNQRCGAYSYRPGAMAQAMREVERLRPTIRARGWALLRDWDGSDVRVYQHEDVIELEGW